MNPSAPCGQTCGASCPLSGAGAAGGQRGALAEGLARFDREATRGVCDTGRYRMPYYVWGAGPPLVFIHGAADVSRSFVPVVSRLAGHFRCVAYDLPLGHRDGARLGQYRHGDLVDDLWALLDQLGVQRSYLLGSSFGSTIALAAMRRRPERVPRAVLQGALAHRPLRRMARVFAWLLRRLPGPMARLPRRQRMLERVHGPAFAGQPE